MSAAIVRDLIERALKLDCKGEDVLNVGSYAH